MQHHDCPHIETHQTNERKRLSDSSRSFLTRWFFANSLLAGLLGLIWLILRSGTKPSRFAYPCQQAAISAATLAFGAPVVSAVLAARRQVVRGLRTPLGVAIAAAGLVVTLGAWSYMAWAAEYRGPSFDPPPDYNTDVFHVADCREDPIDDNFVGLDNLITLMGQNGLKFYKSSNPSLESGPDGIIAADDVVVIKINYQWSERGGTNTDVLRGLIRRIVDHPDTFTGEVIVGENTQFVTLSTFNRAYNNAQDHGQSPYDVVTDFQSAGYEVSEYVWTTVRSVLVDEYSDGDMNDGYVRYDYDGIVHGRVSYPKFRSDHGTYVSLRDGIWDPVSETYDRQHLKFINMPVFKSHGGYGITACVKHHMGTVTGALSTSSHSGIHYGILGAMLGEIGMADLNILDAVWILARPGNGPSCSYGTATRRNELVASVDVVAADMWAVTNIMVPAYIDNGYSSWPSADPGNPGSTFRQYLDNSMDRILAAGYDATNDLDQIDSHTWAGANDHGDFNGSDAVDLPDFAQFDDCMAGPDLPPDPTAPVTVADCLSTFDFDGDGDVDPADFHRFQRYFGESY